MYSTLITIIFAQLLTSSYAFSPVAGRRRFRIQRVAEKIKEPAFEDPNYDAHLPNFIKAGSADDSRPSPDIAVELRKRFKVIEGGGRKAAKVLKTANYELSVELEELADELAETHEKFVQTALWWDAWGTRSSPDIGSMLREKERGTQSDPNFVDNLPRFMGAGLRERETPDLPSELRLLKYKNMAGVKRMAASELRQSGPGNVELAAELEEMADEIEESHLRFEELARSLRARQLADDNRPDLIQK